MQFQNEIFFKLVAEKLKTNCFQYQDLVVKKSSPKAKIN